MIKIAIFDLTDCEGCELQFLELKEKLLDFFQRFDVLNWRLLKEKKRLSKYDIAIITGTPIKKEEVELLKEVRARSKFLVALGSCACTGGIASLIKEKQRKRLIEYVYGKKWKTKSILPKPISFYVKVDKEIPGCPVNFSDLNKFIKEIPHIAKPSSPLPFPSPCELIPDYVTKIEGHGTLNINFKEKTAWLKVEEGERLVEGILLGRGFKEAPYITSRICGICPVAHNLASIKAMENIFGYTPNHIIIKLRKLLLFGQIIHSHLFHLFFLALPDFMGYKDSIQLASACPAEFHLALNIKRVSEDILKIIGGQVIHPTNTKIGGFIKLPPQSSLLKLLDNLKNTIDEAEDLAKIFLNLPYPKISRETEYLAISSGSGYEFYDGKVASSFGKSFSAGDYKKEIKEEIRPNQTAKIGKRNSSDFMVGALARLNLFYKFLNPKAQKLLTQSNITLPSHNPFHNNLAQAIEILHLYEESIKILNELCLINEKDYKQAFQNQSIKIKKGKGVGALEAPRGTLYHFYEVDENGLIKKCDIVTPTVCNLGNLEKNAKELLQKTCKLSKNKCIKQVEMLIRAYDPCITCAVH